MDISLKWFKEQIKKSVDRVVAIRVDKAAKELAEEELNETDFPEEENEDWDEDNVWNDEEEDEVDEGGPLYQSVKLINDVLTVVLPNGDILTKLGATKEDFYAVREAVSSAQIVETMSSPESIQERKIAEQERAKNEALYKGIEFLRSSSDFEINGNFIYIKGIKRSIPQLLVERFAELLGAGDKENYDALKKFWLKCCLNPNAQSAEDLYGFLAHHQFKIDKHGNFYAYRRVVSKDSANRKLVEFIANAYTKVKAVWKKRPADYRVMDRPETGYAFEHVSSEVNGTFIGNLERLYLDLPNMQDKSYTSAHTGLEDYRVGEMISMPRQDGDAYNGASCSKGFHAASKAYDYSGFGDTPILMIINPMDVLAVPRGEWGKLRTCRWFFATTLPEGEKYILDDEDFNVAELGDIFEAKSAVNLEEHVKNSFAEEVKRHTFHLSAVTSDEIKNIVVSLDAMRNAIANRVKNLA